MSIYPKVSIITVCYNCQDVIEKTIQSVIQHDRGLYEYIVVDGGSTDNTLQIIHKYNEYIDFLISEPDNGIYDAMNKGLARANAEWVFFLNAGDYFLSGSPLHDVPFDYYSGKLKVAGIYGDYMYSTKEGIMPVLCTKPFFTKGYFKLIFNPSMGFHHQSVFTRTQYAKKIMFDTNYKLCADFNMIFTLYKQGCEYVHYTTFITCIEGSDGASFNNPILQRKEHYKLLGLDQSPLAKMVLIYKSIKRKIKEIVL